MSKSVFSLDRSDQIKYKLHAILVEYLLVFDDNYPSGLYIDNDLAIDYLEIHRRIGPKILGVPPELESVYLGCFSYDDIVYPVFKVLYRGDLYGE